MARVLFLALLLAAAEKSPADLVEELTVPATRNGAYRALLAMKDPRAVPLLVRALPGGDFGTQYYGVVILNAYRGKIGDDALRQMVATKIPYLVVHAGAYLHARGIKAAHLAMADALLGPSLTFADRTRMLARLDAVDSPAIRAAVRSLLQVGMDSTEAWMALYVLHLQADDAACAHVARLLADPRGPIRALAGAGLLRFGDETHVSKFAPLIASGAADAGTFSRIRLLLQAAPRIPKPALDALVTRLEKEGVAATKKDILILLGLFPHRPAREALRARLEDEDPVVVGLAYDALLAIPGLLRPELLRPLLEAKSPLVRLRAADTLRRHDDAFGLPVVRKLLATGDDATRIEAAIVLGKFRHSGAVAPLIDGLLDPLPAVRAQALAGLGAVLYFLYPYRAFDLGSTGYDVNGSPEERRAAASLIQAWWAEHRRKDW